MSRFTRSLPASTLLGALLLFSACTDDAASVPATPPDAPVAADTKAARATAAGLSVEDVAYLDSTGVAVYVPVTPEGWQFSDAFTERDDATGGFVPFYSVSYLTPAGACVSLSATSGPRQEWTAAPPNERTVTVAGVPTGGPVRLGWGAASDAGAGGGATGWDNQVATEGFGTQGVTYVAGSSTDEDCRLASPDDVEALLATLRPLDPAADA